MEQVIQRLRKQYMSPAERIVRTVLSVKFISLFLLVCVSSILLLKPLATQLGAADHSIYLIGFGLTEWLFSGYLIILWIGNYRRRRDEIDFEDYSSIAALMDRHDLFDKAVQVELGRQEEDVFLGKQVDCSIKLYDQYVRQLDYATDKTSVSRTLGRALLGKRRKEGESL